MNVVTRIINARADIRFLEFRYQTSKVDKLRTEIISKKKEKEIAKI